eukprot:3660712-Rhodomonas_salina.5
MSSILIPCRSPSLSLRLGQSPGAFALSVEVKVGLHRLGQWTERAGCSLACGLRRKGPERLRRRRRR